MKILFAAAILFLAFIGKDRSTGRFKFIENVNSSGNRSAASENFSGVDKLTGRWESTPSPTGSITGVVFKPDNSLEAYINKKAFVSGTYTFNPEDSTLSFVDNGCNGARGIYKLLFYSNSDSLRFQGISDSCQERKKGMQRLIMGRVK